MSGFVLIYRQLLENPAFNSDAEAMAFAWMVVKASWKPASVRYKGRSVELNRGDLCISVRDMAERLERSKDWVSRFLIRLENAKMIEKNRDRGCATTATPTATATATASNVITICNYDKYQAELKDAATASRQLVRQHRDSTATQNKEDNNRTREKDDKSSLVILKNYDGEKELFGKQSDIDDAVKNWNLGAVKTGWPKILKLDQARREKLRRRLKEHSLEGWNEVLRKAMRSEMLGRDPPSWFSFDWLTKNSGNILKLIEGNYDNKFNSGAVNTAKNAKTTWQDALEIDHRPDVSSDNRQGHSTNDGLLSITSSS